MSSDEIALKKLGHRVRTFRKEAGLTQEQLASLTDYDPTYISLLERGKRTPSYLTLLKLAKHLGCRVADITDE